MEPDLEALREKEVGYRPFLDLSMKGDGIDISHKAIALSDCGGTNYRFQEENGKIDCFTIDATVYGRVMDLEAHTWGSDGKHIEILNEKEIKEDKEIEREVEIKKDGEAIRVSLSLRFYFK